MRFRSIGLATLAILLIGSSAQAELLQQQFLRP